MLIAIVQKLTSPSGLYPYNVEADFGMQSAVLNGLVQEIHTINNQLPLECGSGNCTWNAVRSLAVCSVCNNITASLREFTSKWPAVYFLSDANMAASIAESTTYSLHGRVFLNNRNGVNDAILTMSAYGTGHPWHTVSFKEFDTLIWVTGILRAFPTVNVSASWPNDFEAHATECGIYYCVKEYVVNITNNKVLETSTEVSSIRRAFDSWQYSERVRQGLNASMLESLVFPSSRRANNRTDLRLGDMYNVSQSAILSFSAFINSTFTRSETEPYNASDPDNSRAIGGFYISRGDSAAAQREPSAMQALYDSDDLNATYAALAASMSNAIRTHNSGSSAAVGKLGQLTTVYRISWPWIALSAVVVLASVIQLAKTIIGDGDTPIWKSSTLATMSRGPYVQAMLHGADTINDFRIAASERNVLLFDKREHDLK